MNEQKGTGGMNEEVNRQINKLLFEQNPEAVFSFDLSGHIQSGNKAFLQLVECTGEQLFNINIKTFLPQQDVVQTIQKVLNQEIQTYETLITTTKGNRRTIRITIFPILEHGKISVLYGIARDISELISKENELKLIENKYWSAVENSLSAFILTIPGGTVIDANHAALNMFGYTTGEIKTLTRSQLLDSHDPNFHHLMALREHQGYVKGELTGIRKDGTRFPCEFSSVIFIDLYGNSRISTNIIDISARRTAENAIDQKQQLLQAIIENAEVGISVIGLDGQYILNNRSMFELLGTQHVDVKNSDQSGSYKMYYAESQKVVPRHELPIVRAMHGDLIKNQRYLIKNPKKGNIYLSSSSSVIRDPEGNIIAGMVIDKDITKHIEDENALNNAIKELEKSNLRFKYATKAASDAIWDWDLITDELHWGDGFRNLFGHTLTKVTVNNQFWSDHIHPEDQQSVLAGINQAFRNTGQTFWEDEFRYLKDDLTYANVIDRGLIVRDTGGKAIRMIGAMRDVTQLKKQEAALKESNERFSYAAQATSEAIWEWNSSAPDKFKEHGYKELFGYDFAENTADISLWAAKIHPDDYDQVMRTRTAVSLDRQSTKRQIEYRFLRSDNEYVYIKDKAVLLRDEEGNLVRVIGSMQDITRQKKEEQRLKLLESVITNSTNGIIIAGIDIIPDIGPRVIYVNEAFTNMTGYSPEEMNGGTPRILYGPKTDQKELSRLWRTMEKKERCDIEVISYTKAGNEIWIQMTVIPVQDTGGNYSHFIAIMKDVTERKNHELEKERLIKDLTMRVKELKQFTYITSHNLRSPVANLLGLISLTDDMEISDANLKAIHSGFRTSAETLNHTINDLMSVLNSKDHQFIRKEEVSLIEMLNHVLNQVTNLTEETHPVIHHDFSEAGVIKFHRAYLESIFLNLVTNAIKYRSPLRTLKISIMTKVIDNKIILTFEDNGIGLDVKRHQNRIFGFYQKFHDHPDSKGLGLYLVKSHMEDLGGTVGIESTINVGTKLILTFDHHK